MNYLYLTFAVFVALQVCDILTTVNILRFRNGTELNPVTNLFISKLGLVGGLVAIKALIVVPVGAAVYLNIVPLWSILLAVAITLAIVTHNVIEMRK